MKYEENIIEFHRKLSHEFYSNTFDRTESFNTNEECITRVNAGVYTMVSTLKLSKFSHRYSREVYKVPY